jgi:hypothetical protein
MKYIYLHHPLFFQYFFKIEDNAPFSRPPFKVNALIFIIFHQN